MALDRFIEVETCIGEPEWRLAKSYYRYADLELRDEDHDRVTLHVHEDSGIVVADVARFESWLATLKTNIYEEED